MKNITFGLLLLPVLCNAQITVGTFSPQIKCDIDGLYDLPPIEAVSEFGPVTTNLDEQIFSGGCLGTLVRTFTYSDKLGNTASAQQFVSITDNEGPRLYGVPVDTIAGRDKIPVATEVSSRDNSGNIYPVTLSEEITDHSIIRTWTCTDACGNVTTGKQIITLN